MATSTIQLRNIPGTEAAIGWAAGGHTVVVDRPAGKAGGMGLGFNGAQLLGLAIGGCLCNDLRYVAQDMGIDIASIGMEVTVTLEGAPLMAIGAAVRLEVVSSDAQADIDALIARARQVTMVSNSIARGIAVDLTVAPAQGAG
jgi:organic hydroperoxide reductase OsmC/OhrA